MALNPGDKLGPYEIVEAIGQGGMGAVYRARDTRLGRDVAVKVSDQKFSERFEREARVISSLNHPNICHLYDVGDNYLVMELVEGETLSARIKQGPIPLEEALHIAKQIADALEAAHEKGIVHRDLKPGNVMLKEDGPSGSMVKVLDFGLAKVAPGSATASDSPDPELSPTISMAATQAGVILGTAAYMAPEQARGKVVDKRADIWSFGVVLYEMVTGQKPFAGDDLTETLASVVKVDPDLSGIPEELQPLLQKCLEKSPRRRLQDIRGIETLLELGRAKSALQVETRSTSVKAGLLPWLVAAALAVVLAFMVLRPEVVAPVSRLSIPLPPGQEITSRPAITRDGRTIAYTAQQSPEEPQLYLRDLDSFESRAVPESAGATQPFFSPDGKWVGFFAQGQLQKVEVAGGSPLRLADAPEPLGGTWTDDTIIYGASLNSGLLRIPSGGGTPEVLTHPDGAAEGYSHVFPEVLPGGERVLFTIWGQAEGIAVLSLDSREWEMILPATIMSASFDSRGETQGRLLILNESADVRTAPFNAASPAPVSSGTVVLSNVFYELEKPAPWLSISDTASVVYTPANPGKTSLAWVDREGRMSSLGTDQDIFREVALSPDGTKAAVRRGWDIWIHDLERGTRSRLTAANTFNSFPIWTEDSTRVFFASNTQGNWDIYSRSADGSGAREEVLIQPYDQFPLSILADGTLLYGEADLQTGNDLWIRTPDGTTSAWKRTPFSERSGVFSPGSNGGQGWIAYESDESGRPEIYAEAYPTGTDRIVVSDTGGATPKWSRNGRELFYVAPDAVMSVTIGPDGSFGSPRKLFERGNFIQNFLWQVSYDVSGSGDKFLIVRRDPGSVPQQLNVILNWDSNSR